MTGVNEPAPKTWSTVCELTNRAMEAMVEIEQTLISAGDDRLTPLEFRTLLWVRCSLASLYGVRADETMNGADEVEDLLAAMDGEWMDRLLLE